MNDRKLVTLQTSNHEIAALLYLIALTWPKGILMGETAAMALQAIIEEMVSTLQDNNLAGTEICEFMRRGDPTYVDRPFSDAVPSLFHYEPNAMFSFFAQKEINEAIESKMEGSENGN